MQVEGQIALITGGASGIGFSTVQQYLKAGARVVIGDLVEPPENILNNYEDEIFH